MMSASREVKKEMVRLSPVAFAELLGLTASDSPYLATADTDLPKDWAEEWKARSGTRELTTADLCIVLGAHLNTVYRYLNRDASPRLKCRVGGGHGRGLRRFVSPANLIAFLKARSAAAGVVPKIHVTAGQRAKRAIDDQARLAAICGEGNRAA